MSNSTDCRLDGAFYVFTLSICDVLLIGKNARSGACGVVRRSPWLSVTRRPVCVLSGHPGESTACAFYQLKQALERAAGYVGVRSVRTLFVDGDRSVTEISRKMMGRKHGMRVHRCCDLSCCRSGPLQKRPKGLSVRIYMRELQQVSGLTLDTRPRHKAVYSATISEGLTGNCLIKSNRSKYALERTNGHLKIVRR